MYTKGEFSSCPTISPGELTIIWFAIICKSVAFFHPAGIQLADLLIEKAENHPSEPGLQSAYLPYLQFTKSGFMKLRLKIVIGLVIVLLIVGGVWGWISFHEIPLRELSKGQPAIIGGSDSGNSIYLFNPRFRSWRRLPTNNLFPGRMAWSPDGKKIAFTFSTSDASNATTAGIAMLNLENMET